jgi:hypothetical protein
VPTLIYPKSALLEIGILEPSERLAWKTTTLRILLRYGAQHRKAPTPVFGDNMLR